MDGKVQSARTILAVRAGDEGGDVSTIDVARPELFALPLVGRAGLGNALFPWARAELFARRYGARVLAPYWGSLRLGPHLRREPDKRRYAGLFLAEHHTTGYRRLIVAALGRRVSEQELDIIREPRRLLQPSVVEFSGMADLFSPLVGEGPFIRHQLWHMTTKALRSSDCPQRGRFIAMHVRRGDITRQGFTERQLAAVNQYTSLSWFASMVQAVRQVLRRVPIVVFTDGSHDEVIELIRIGDVRLHQRQSAITDLWELAHASLLFASGFSTFSMWASYLGGMPTIYAPGKLQQLVQPEGIASVEIELPEHAPIPAAAIARF
jgi:hypothetical protein